MRGRPRASIVVSGDEVLLGRVVERNAAFIAADLDARGLEVEGVRIVSDRLDAIVDAVRDARSVGADLIVTTGGLGPTHDDRTMEAVAIAAGRELTLDPVALGMVRERVEHAIRAYDIRPERIGAGIEKQASLPAGGAVLPPVGTAPGCLLELDDTLVVVLPGPPGELQPMWRAALEHATLARLLASAPGRRRLTLRLVGLGESEIVTALEEMDQELVQGVSHGIYTRPGEIDVVIDAPVSRPGDADRLALALRDRFGDRVFSDDGRTVEVDLAERLLSRGEMLAVAESCTGGGLGARLTELPGSSAWFAGGIIAYANRAKIALLGVPESTIARWGAVSSETAAAMAEGARARLRTAWAVSVTGVAGPGGGTPDKPVGLVYVGVAGPSGTRTSELRLPGDRAAVRARAATLALHGLREGLRSC